MRLHALILAAGPAFFENDCHMIEIEVLSKARSTGQEDAVVSLCADAETLHARY